MSAPPLPPPGSVGEVPAVLNPATWGWVHYAVFIAIIQLGFEVYLHVLPWVFDKGAWRSIAWRGRHLDKLSTLDRCFIRFNRMCVPVMTYHYLLHAVHNSRIPWALGALGVRNSLVALPVCFACYDLVYATGHRLMHARWLYAYVHKHHHRQIVPTRGNTDAINVHPIEFFFGEYNHIAAVWATAWLVGSMHALTCLLFLFFGGALATLNHTRFDVRITLFGLPLFDVRAHDVHHRVPMSNFGQYTMLWDRVCGWYRPYEYTDEEDDMRMQKLR